MAKALITVDQKALVMKLREAGLPQAFFTQKRNLNATKQLRGVLNSTWTVFNDDGEKITKSFTAVEKKEATAIWG